MNSSKAKVLHEVFFAPMVHHVIHSTLPLRATQTLIIVGHQESAVTTALKKFDLEFMTQEKQLGTGHAVCIAEDAVADGCSTIMILCGDIPLIKAVTLQDMHHSHRQQNAALTVMTTTLEDPTNYGRILCDADGKLEGIVEQKDATAKQLKIKEINAGIYCVDKTFLFSALKKIGANNEQGEIYLTDIVQMAVGDSMIVEKYTNHNPMDALGVNSRIELADAQKILQARRNEELMLQGVSMYSPETICISPDSLLGSDTELKPGVHISGASIIGCSCKIGQGVIIENCKVEDNVSIGAYSYLADTTITAGAILTPFSNNFYGLPKI